MCDTHTRSVSRSPFPEDLCWNTQKISSGIESETCARSSLCDVRAGVLVNALSNAFPGDRCRSQQSRGRRSRKKDNAFGITGEGSTDWLNGDFVRRSSACPFRTKTLTCVEQFPGYVPARSFYKRAQNLSLLKIGKMRPVLFKVYKMHSALSKICKKWSVFSKYPKCALF